MGQTHDAAMNRAIRRAAAKHAKHKPTRRHKPLINPVGEAIIRGGEAIFDKSFNQLKREADIQCIASDNLPLLVLNVGFLLYVILRGLELDQLEIDEEDTKVELEAMKDALMQVQETDAMTPANRKTLMDGMDTLVALSEVLSKEARAVAWAHVSRVTGIKR
jgi:hypothetical protein